MRGSVRRAVSPSPGEQVVFKDSSHPEAELWEAAAIITVGKTRFAPALLCVSPKGMNVAVEPTSPSSPFCFILMGFPASSTRSRS